MSNRALPSAVYTAGDDHVVDLGTFRDANGYPLSFTGNKVEVIVRDGVAGRIYAQHSAVSPNAVAQDGITSDGQGGLKFTILATDLPAFDHTTRLEMQVRRIVNPGASQTVETLGHGEVIARAKIFRA